MGHIFSIVSRFWSWLWTRPRHKVGSVMYCGDTGSFKTYSAVADALRWRSPIFANIDIRPNRGQRFIKWSDFPALLSKTCGTVLMDEAGEVLDAQLWQSLPFDVKQSAKEQRKNDWRLIMTTQSPDFVDKVFRTIAHRIVFCRSFSVPLLGWILPWTHRKGLRCACCGEVMIKGNLPSFATVIIHEDIDWKDWENYRRDLDRPSSVISGMFGRKDSGRPKLPVKRRRFMLYNQRIADAYGSAQKLDLTHFARGGKKQSSHPNGS